MYRSGLQGEKVGFHVDLALDRPDLCWGRCSLCAAGAYRYEDEAIAEKVLAMLHGYVSNCADGR